MKTAIIIQIDWDEGVEEKKATDLTQELARRLHRETVNFVEDVDQFGVTVHVDPCNEPDPVDLNDLPAEKRPYPREDMTAYHYFLHALQRIAQDLDSPFEEKFNAHNIKRRLAASKSAVLQALSGEWKRERADSQERE